MERAAGEPSCPQSLNGLLAAAVAWPVPWAHFSPPTMDHLGPRCQLQLHIRMTVVPQTSKPTEPLNLPMPLPGATLVSNFSSPVMDLIYPIPHARNTGILVPLSPSPTSGSNHSPRPSRPTAEIFLDFPQLHLDQPQLHPEEPPPDMTSSCWVALLKQQQLLSASLTKPKTSALAFRATVSPPHPSTSLSEEYSVQRS